MLEPNNNIGACSDRDDLSLDSNLKVCVDLDSSKRYVSLWIYYAAISVPLAVVLMPLFADLYLAADKAWGFPLIFKFLFGAFATQILLVTGVLDTYLIFSGQYSNWRDEFYLKNWKWSHLFFGPTLACLAFIPLTLVSVISYFSIEFIKANIPKQFLKFFESKYQLQEYLLNLDWKFFIIFAFAAVVVAPIVEETAFRNIFYRALNSKLSNGTSIFLTSFVFAMVHMNLVVFPAILLLGILLQVVFNYKKSIYPSIFLHASYNAISLCTIAVIKYISK
jgi:membrane protease YdiL (CAAX protease family)